MLAIIIFFSVKNAGLFPALLCSFLLVHRSSFSLPPTSSATPVFTHLQLIESSGNLSSHHPPLLCQIIHSSLVCEEPAVNSRQMKKKFLQPLFFCSCLLFSACYFCEYLLFFACSCSGLCSSTGPSFSMLHRALLQYITRRRTISTQPSVSENQYCCM